MLSYFENEFSKGLDEDSWWNAFVIRWVGKDDLKAAFTVTILILGFLGFLFSFLFAPLATLTMIGFGPACKPGKL